MLQLVEKLINYSTSLRNPVTCDLCDVELATAQDLEDHLESRVHWGTLEYIQENNHYDDLVIAFLQVLKNTTPGSVNPGVARSSE